MGPRVDVPDRPFLTLVDVLRWRAARQPEVDAFTFWTEGGLPVACTYGELDGRARAIAASLQAGGPPRGRALLLYPPGLDFIAAFVGCLYAGCVPVPTHPLDLARLTRSISRLLGILSDAQPAFILTQASGLSAAAAVSEASGAQSGPRWLATDEISPPAAGSWRPPDLQPDATAFLQYTSGSTSAPRGVQVSHAALLHNVELIRCRFGGRADEPVVSWLPPYHDMGLVGGILASLYAGNALTLLSPLAFLKRPVRWLEAISKTRAVISGGPNFAYDLCVRRVSAEQRTRLDLGGWRLAFSGAEPVRADTLDAFAEAFKECGFRREAFFPCYGLAEATLIVSGGRRSEPPVVRSLRRSDLEEGRVAAAEPADPAAVTVVGCGRSLPELETVIVDPETQRSRPAGMIGEIWIAGPSVANGYWDRPEESTRTFAAFLADSGRGPYLRTGDLGFLEDGELFVTGRLKDLIVCDGRNHLPQDIEQTVEKSHPALRPGYSVAFSVDGASSEEVVILTEVPRWGANGHGEQAPLVEIQRAIQRAVSEVHDVRVHAVVLLKPGMIHRTSSGKVQRRLCRAAFLAGTLAVGGPLGEGSEP